MRGRLSICRHHGNRLRCIDYLSSTIYICSCNLSITIGESNFPESWAVTMETKVKNQVFKIYGIFR